MLHYSNASSRKRVGDIWWSRGGLAWWFWQERGVINTVVGLGSSGVGLVVYRREEGGRNKKYIANISMTVHDKTSNGARGALTRYEVIPVKGGNIRENIPGVSRFRTDESEGESCVFAILGMWRTNGPRIRIHLVVLSNFHVQSFSIRATIYFILIFKRFKLILAFI